MVKTIAIVDTLWEGHHPTYFKLFCSIAIDHGYKVLALSPAVNELARWKDQKKYTADQIEIFTCSELASFYFPIQFIGSFLTTCKRWLNVKNTLKDTEPDMVFFPWLDNYLSVFLFPCLHKIIFPFSWSGIYFHPIYLRKKVANRFRQKVRETAANVFKSCRCLGVAVLDEGISSSLQKMIGNKPVIVLPDVADDAVPDSHYSVVKEIKAKSKNRKIVLLAGALAKRKGFFVLIETALNFPSENLIFVFAGRLVRSTFSKEELVKIEKLVSDPPENCFFFLEKIPKESQFNALIAACDVLYACYENFPHSSNMLTKAALFKKPIIVSNRYCMGERVNKFEIGLTIDEGDIRGCINAIKALTKNENVIADIFFEKYILVNSIEKFSDEFRSILSS